MLASRFVGKYTLSLMKLCQGLVWKTNQECVRIVAVERLAVDYMTMKTPETEGGVHKRVTKKQFCNFVKTATLVSQEKRVFPADHAKHADKKNKIEPAATGTDAEAVVSPAE